MSSELTGLLKRVKSAPSANYQLECEIKAAIDPLWPAQVPPNYTASVDAALALVDRNLPGWGVYFRRDKETTGAGMLLPDHFRVTPAHEEAASIPLAILAALLSALIAYPTGGRMDE